MCTVGVTSAALKGSASMKAAPQAGKGMMQRMSGMIQRMIERCEPEQGRVPVNEQSGLSLYAWRPRERTLRTPTESRRGRGCSIKLFFLVMT